MKCCKNYSPGRKLFRRATGKNDVDTSRVIRYLNAAMQEAVKKTSRLRRVFTVDSDGRDLIRFFHDPCNDVPKFFPRALSALDAFDRSRCLFLGTETSVYSWLLIAGVGLSDVMRVTSCRHDSLRSEQFVKMFIKLEEYLIKIRFLIAQLINIDSHRCFDHHQWPSSGIVSIQN